MFRGASFLLSSVASVDFHRPDDANPASPIWARVAGLMPTHATVENLRFSYSFDPDLNHVGAPYAPVVTVEIAQ